MLYLILNSCPIPFGSLIIEELDLRKSSLYGRADKEHEDEDEQQQQQRCNQGTNIASFEKFHG